MISKKKRIITISTIAVILIGVVVMGLLNRKKDADYAKLFSIENSDSFPEGGSEGTYASYLSSHQDKSDYAGDDIVIPAEKLNQQKSKGFLLVENFQNETGKQVQSTEESELHFPITVEQSGFYEINFKYINTKEGLKAAQRQILIDGEIPFDEAYNLVFNRLFKDDEELKFGEGGNQMRPSQIELRQWQNEPLKDKRGFYYNNYKFYLEAGQHTVSVIGETGDLTIAALTLSAPKTTENYQTYLEQHPSDYPDAEPIVIEAENTAEKTVTTIRPEWVNDPKTTPRAVSTMRYNAFGGPTWSEGGQRVQWNFHIDTSGYYTIALRSSVPQTGTVAYREIKIDGEIPFDLFQEYPFSSKNSLACDYLLDNENKPIKIYLEEGDHTISMETKVGPTRKVIQEVEDTTDQMDLLYRNITLVTASIRDESGNIVNDVNRDYNLDKKIPNLNETLEYIANKLDSAATKLLEMSQDEKPEHLSSLERGSKMIRKMIEDPELIPQMMNEYSNILISLNDVSTSLVGAPLYIDYIMFCPGENKLDENKSNVWDQFVGSVESVIYSFTSDYNAMSKDGEELNVWVMRGRDWANIIDQLTMEEFTQQTGIRVNVNILPLLSDYMVMTSYSGGNSPDVAMGMSTGTPVDFAARNAAVDLTQFDGFEKLVSQLVQGSLLPYEYKGGIYGLPETMDFQVLFYRTDIFEELNLKVPDTWEELYQLIPYLQENGMDFYFPSGAGGGATLLYQYGGSYYNEDKTKSLLDSAESIASFSEYVDLFNKYKVPLQADPFQRMRMGTMPLAVGGYDLYTKLTSSAPELNGKWAIAPMLGKKQEDGTINRSAPAGSTAIVMLNSIENKENGWKFIEWWLSKDTQVSFGSEVESLLGAGSRWNTANVEAMKELNWETDDLNVILEQWKHLKVNPTVLGGYFTDRQMLTVWNETALQGISPRIALEDAVRKINKELQRKQLEFE